MLNQIALTNGGRINVQLVTTLARLDLTNKENILLFVCNEAVESKLVKIETCGQSFKASAIVPDLKIPHITTLDL